MLSIGITGGMGGGKTICCQVFELLGVPVYYSDIRGKYILQESEKAKAQATAEFGKDIFDNKGILDRRKLAAMVFNNAARLRALEAIVHPAVQEDFEDFRREHLNHPYIVKEAALLFESGSYRVLDKIIVVDAPLNIRIARIQKRDAISEEDILARISKQWDVEKKLKMADYIIRNNEKELILPQILKLHNEFSMSGLVAK